MPSIITDDARRVIAEQRLAYVASVCADGTPNLSPKGTLAVWDDDHLVYADIRSPGTAANIALNPNVEVNVVDPFSRKGYRFKGVAETIREGELFSAMFSFYERMRGDKSKPLPEIRAFVLIKVTRVRPLTSPAYDDGTDEQSIRARWVAHYAKLQDKL